MVTAQLLLLVSWLSPALSIVPLAHFFPHGISKGDKKLARDDDSSSDKLHLKVPFHFFGHVYRSHWVNVNGAISFASPIDTYTPECGPLSREYSAIGPYWADVDISTTGNIYYRQSKRKSDLKKARREIENAFPDIEHLKLKWALIVTWYNVTYFPDEVCNATYVCNTNNLKRYGYNDTTIEKSCDECKDRKRNTFQAIITTDGRRSYAIFYYNKLEWTTGTASQGQFGLGGIPARAGFDLGDGKHYTMIPGSCNGDVLKINHKSNVGSPGKWIFRVDEANIRSAGCLKQNESGEQIFNALARLKHLKSVLCDLAKLSILMSPELIVALTCTALVTLVGCSANLVVIIVIFGDKAMRHSSMNILLANLAVSDFLYNSILFGMFVSLVFEELWDFGSYAIAATNVCLSVSIYTNVAVCIERYVAVVHCMYTKRYFSVKRVLLYVLCLWIVFFLFDIPLYVNLLHCRRTNGMEDKSRLEGLLFCAREYQKIPDFYPVLSYIVRVVIPVPILSILYFKTCRALLAENSFIHAEDNQQSQSIITLRRSVVKMLIVCAVIFYILYTIPAVYTVYQTITDRGEDSMTTFWTIIVIMLASSVNPFIYALYSAAFRERVKSLLCCRLFPAHKINTVKRTQAASDVI